MVRGKKSYQMNKTLVNYNDIVIIEHNFVPSNNIISSKNLKILKI